MKTITVSLLLVLGFQVSALAQSEEKISDRLYSSEKVLDELLQAPDAGIPKDLMQKAECVAVIPGVKKAALGFGGQYGRGVVACRKDQGKGPWGSPSMIGLSGGSVGFQLGGSSTDVVMLFMTPDSVKFLLRDKVTIGVDMAAAGGPKGRSLSAETSASMRAEILTYGRSRGAFAGVSLTGASLSPDKDANKTLYGKQMDAKDLLLTGNVAIPSPAQKLINLLAANSK